MTTVIRYSIFEGDRIDDLLLQIAELELKNANLLRAATDLGLRNRVSHLESIVRAAYADSLV